MKINTTTTYVCSYCETEWETMPLAAECEEICSGEREKQILKTLLTKRVDVTKDIVKCSICDSVIIALNPEDTTLPPALSNNSHSFFGAYLCDNCKQEILNELIYETFPTWYPSSFAYFENGYPNMKLTKENNDTDTDTEEDYDRLKQLYLARTS